METRMINSSNTTRPSVRLPVAQDNQEQGLLLETRIDNEGVTTYHSVTPDATGGAIEKIYDQHKRPIKIIKRCGRNRAETFLDPETGRRTRVAEVATMPDGNLISSDTIFHDSARSSQIVTIFRPHGLLVRIIERESRGATVVFQGQTDYDVNGTPASSVNQHVDPASGKLVHREQIHWMGEGLRAMTEHTYFDAAGHTVRYIKVIHNSAGGPFSEETHTLDPATGKLSRRELISFAMEGIPNSADLLLYDQQGQICKRRSTFFDAEGNPLFTRDSGAA